MSYQEDEARFLEAMATYFSFTGDRRLVFIQRLLEANSDLKDVDLAEVLTIERHQLLYYLKDICNTLDEEGCDSIQVERGRWKIAKKWLRFTIYPQWEKGEFPQPRMRGNLDVNWIWQSLVEKARSPADWMRFSTVEDRRGIKVPPGRKQPVIESDTPYFMKIELPAVGGNLLLLNRGLDTRYVLSPSMAFAPNSQLVDAAMFLPQREGMCEDIKFDSAGKEEFLAVVTEESWNWDWLVPNEEEPAPVWDTERLNQLWMFLEGKRNWQAFYKSFEVV